MIVVMLFVGVVLGDCFGCCWVYNFGILVFMLGLVFCVLVNWMLLLIVVCVIVGIGVFVMILMLMVILMVVVLVVKCGKVLGIWSGIGGLVLIVGLVLGGLIVVKLIW